uniref:Protein kinase domain-containing protein n=3 Tax=Steinernema glaseri TaxID=37863 RepID=A0A1I7ZLW4_9BILA
MNSDLGASDEMVCVPTAFQSTSRINDNEILSLIKISRLSSGKNRFGKVYKFLDTKKMIEIAATRIKLDEFDPWSHSRHDKISEFLDELDVFATLRHQRIARFFGSYVDHAKNKLTLFREYLPNGSVLDRVKQAPLEECTALKFFRQTAEALYFLHSQQPTIVHRNVRASNLLLTISNDVKLCDFGVSLELSADDFEGEFSETIPSYYRITLLTAAPEALPDISTPRKFRTPYDIWSLGCVLVTMLTQNPPYFDECQDKSDNEVFKFLSEQAADGSRRFSYKSISLIPDASEEVQHLLNSVLVLDEEQRPTAEQILQLDQVKLNERLCSVNPLSMGSKKRRQFSLDMDEIIADRSHNNGTTRTKKTRRYLPLLNRTVTIDSAEDNDDIEIGNNSDHEEEEEPESPLYYFFRFHISRMIIFLILLSKWSGLVFISAVVLAFVASVIFLMIYLVFIGIEGICGCNLNEGFVVLIALILLPIMILLTTLCCNNACEKYNQAVENGTIRRSRFFHGPPQKDVTLCGVTVFRGIRKSGRKANAKKEEKKKDGEEDATAVHLLSKGKIVNNIAQLA